MMRSTIFDGMAVRCKPRYFAGFDADPLLNKGTTQCMLQEDGQTPVSRMIRAIRMMAWAKGRAHFFNMIPGIRSGPVAFRVSMAFNHFTAQRSRRTQNSEQRSCGAPMIGSGPGTGNTLFSANVAASKSALEQDVVAHWLFDA